MESAHRPRALYFEYGCSRANVPIGANMRALWCILLLSTVPCEGHDVSVFRVDDHVYRGRQPAREDFAELARMGIKTILDLRGGPIHEPRERKEVEAAGMQYVSVRLSGIFGPKDAQIAKILSLLQDSRRTPVFIHCRRGDDRVGEVIACYRMAHDHWTNQQAMQEARRSGMSRLEVLMRRYVMHFNPARLPAAARDALP